MNREQEIFHAALDHPDAAGRAALLDEACAGDAALHARIAALLRAADEAGRFLNDAEAPIRESTGARIGRYVLRDKIGEGGFGVVYLAEQAEPVRRTVALKIIKLGMDTRAVVARFEAERQALALMEHPHIARVFDAGATETGRPFFAMELVRGVPITAFCREHRLTVRERIALFQQVCRAIQHAHQKGVIHRDLKPSNILVARDAGAPIAKVIDFGIAKATREPLTDKTLVTRLHAFMGTPAYMSPEQIGLDGADVDTRSDIYSLGALLYELLADAPVLDAQQLLAAGYAAVQHAIHHTEPLAPSARVAALPTDDAVTVALARRTTPPRLVAELRGDLDRIVQKCLEKDRERRYGSADELARDLDRHLRNEPVLARPATVGYRASKFIRRRQRSVLATAAAFALLAGFGAYHGRRLAAERDRAQLEAHKAAKASNLLIDLLTASDPFASRPGGDTTPAGPLDASAERVRREFADQPEMRAEILNAIGRVHLRSGRHERAQPILTEALAAGRASGQPSARLAQTLSDLGILRRERADYAGAQPLLEEALALRRELHRNHHNEVAISLVELGRLHSTGERLDHAGPLFREALEIRQRVLGPEHREIAVSHGDLGLLLWQQGDLAAAEPHLLASLAMHRATLGPDHPNVAGGLANVAQLRFDQGNLAAAEELLREAHGIMKKALGDRHWRTARVHGSLAAVWCAQSRHADAAAALDNAREALRSALGAEHPQVAALDVERGRVLLALGEPARAAAMLRQALAVQRKLSPASGWRVATTQSLLGAALLGCGQPVEAATLLREASAALPDVPGPRGRETAATRRRLAELAGSRVAVTR